MAGVESSLECGCGFDVIKRGRVEQAMLHLSYKTAKPVQRTLAQRDLIPNGSATAKTLDCSLKRWVSLPAACDLQRVSIGSRRHRNNHPLRPDRDYR